MEVTYEKAIVYCFRAFARSGSGCSQNASVDGTWDGEFDTPGGARPFKMELKADGEKLTGTAKRPSGDVPITGTIKGDAVEFAYTIMYGDNALTLYFSGKLDGDSMNGVVTMGSTDANWRAKRSTQ
jgi:hypothetical protein